jgi:GT2 family glycosyltransferase
VLRKIGGFNEEYRTNGEDVDLGLRMTKEGYRLVYLPDVGVHHQRTDTLLSLMSLAYRHSYWQSRAMRENGTDPYSQFKWAVRWLAVSTDSSILRHRDIRLAIISPIVCFSAFAGRIMEMVLRSRL